jgi:hypothetical protein
MQDQTKKHVHLFVRLLHAAYTIYKLSKRQGSINFNLVEVLCFHRFDPSQYSWLAVHAWHSNKSKIDKNKTVKTTAYNILLVSDAFIKGEFLELHDAFYNFSCIFIHKFCPQILNLVNFIYYISLNFLNIVAGDHAL